VAVFFFFLKKSVVTTGLCFFFVACVLWHILSFLFFNGPQTRNPAKKEINLTFAKKPAQSPLACVWLCVSTRVFFLSRLLRFSLSPQSLSAFYI